VSGSAGRPRLNAAGGLASFSCSPVLLLTCSIFACGENRRSQCEFEPAPVGFLTWFFDPSLQRAILEELMNDLASGEVDNAPVAACG
jgi:hypothetical protein